MKSTIGTVPSIPRIYPQEVLTAIMESGCQNYSNDVDYYVIKYNGKWWPYQKLRETFKVFRDTLPEIDLESLRTKV